MAKTTYPCPKCGGTLTKNGHDGNGKQRWVCRDQTSGTVCYSTRNPKGPVTGPSGRTSTPSKPSSFKRKLGGITRFIITAAQNATPVHADFLASLKTFCNFNEAELIVIPQRYKNPTSRWTESQKNEEVWAPELAPYLYNQRKKLCENLILLGDIKTRPTADRPLSGFESITHGESGILGHTKRQLLCVPTPSHQFPKIMTTTGAVTVPNYTDSKSGKKGEFHHVLGALVVEISGKKFHMRQVTADSRTGAFIDWDTRYAPSSVSPAPRLAALILGDTHYRFMDPVVKRATFGEGGIIEQLDPEQVVFHDLLDGYSRNPHHKGNPFIELAKRQVQYHDVRDEVVEAIEFLDKVARDRKAVVVPSNHDDFLRRWVVDTDWRYDVDNADFYLQTALAMVQSTTMSESGASYANPFTYWIRKLTDNPNIITPGMDESYEIAGVECGFHGHRGPNGARGSIRNLSNIGVKVNSGHGHTPGIEYGHYRAGTNSRLRLEYTEGPSSWLHTDILQYADGKRSLLNIIDGEFKY